MTIKYTDEQVLKLLNEVELEFGKALKKAEFPAKEDEDSKEDIKEDAEEAKPAADEKDAEDKAPEADDSKEDEGSKEDIKEDAQEDADKKPEAEDFDYDDDDLSELHKMYSTMGQKEKQAHLDSLHKALGVVAKQPEAQEMAKSEELAKKEETYALIKSENDTLKAKNEELQKNMEVVKNFLATVQKSVPQRKSIESLDFVKKSEDQEKVLSKNEIDELLLKKVKEATLSKSDRVAIDNYYLNGKSVETIKHLLK